MECLIADVRRKNKNKETGSDSGMVGKQKYRLLYLAYRVKRILQREAFRFEPASQLDSQSDSAEDNNELSIEKRKRNATGSKRLNVILM